MHQAKNGEEIKMQIECFDLSQLKNDCDVSGDLEECYKLFVIRCEYRIQYFTRYLPA